MPPGINWTPEEESALWTEWKKQAEGVKARWFAHKYAKTIGRSENSTNGKLNELIQNERAGFPPSTYGKWTNPPIVHGNAFILMDAHFPYHNAEFINNCLKVCRAWKIENCILGGDAFDAESFNAHPDNFADDGKMVIDTRLRSQLIKFANKMKSEKEKNDLIDLLDKTVTEDGNITEELRETRKCLKYIQDTFGHTLWIMGNHEQRIVKLLEKALSVADISRLLGTDNAKWEVSAYFWAVLKSGGVDWQIEHPINSGKGSSKKLAAKFTTNIIMGHGHHISMATDPSGEFIAIEPGAGADEERMGYVSQRHNAGDKHGLGAVIVRNGRAYMLNKFTDWDLMCKVRS